MRYWDGRSLDVIFHVAILQGPFEGNELPFLQSLGRLAPPVRASRGPARSSATPMSTLSSTGVNAHISPNVSPSA
jgi:hypothetical protein